MSNLLVLLVLLMTIFLSSLFSPTASAAQLFSFRGFWGSNTLSIDPDPAGVPPGGVFEVPIATLPYTIGACIAEESSIRAENCSDLVTQGHLPPGTRLI